MFSVVGKVVFPTGEVMKKVDALARAVMGIRSWGITTKIPTQRKEQGGVELVMPSVYLRHLHSKYCVQYVSHPDSVPRAQKEEFERWRGPALDTTLTRMNWTRLPVQAGTGARKAWTSLATSAKAYGLLKAGLAGIAIPVSQMQHIPL